MELGRRQMNSGAGGLVRPEAKAIIGGPLRTAFEQAAGPLPDKLMELADALESAFQRGELGGWGAGRLS